jgi:hypothetical protein
MDDAVEMTAIMDEIATSTVAAAKSLTVCNTLLDLLLDQPTSQTCSLSPGGTSEGTGSVEGAPVCEASQSSPVELQCTVPNGVTITLQEALIARLNAATAQLAFQLVMPPAAR